jgi:peptidoglycan/LPS O-acetylase OafA/YrhL
MIKSTFSFNKVNKQSIRSDSDRIRYWPQLDALRFFAFFAVFVHHFFPITADTYVKIGVPSQIAEWSAAAIRAGAFGVDIFFVLSSFLITTLLIHESLETGKISLRRFYIRRSLRIWPLYYLFLMFSLFILPFLGLTDEIIEFKYVPSFFLFYSNWTIAFWGFPTSVIAILWSLAIEEQFYIVWPVLIKYLKIENIFNLSLLCFFIANMTRILLVFLQVKHPTIWVNTFARLDTIGAGGILALYFYLNPSKFVLKKGNAILGILLSIFLVVVCARFSYYDGFNSIFSYFLVTCACVIMLISFYSLEFPSVLAFLGKISFGLYVFHMLSIDLVKQFINSQFLSRFPVLKVFPSFILTVFFALVSYFFFEKYWLKLKQNFDLLNSKNKISREMQSTHNEVVSD